MPWITAAEPFSEDKAPYPYRIARGLMRERRKEFTTTISPEPRPSADHSSATDLATSAKDGLHGAVVVVSRVVAAA